MAALLAVARLVGRQALRRIHPDEPHRGVLVAGHAHLERVAVDYAHDLDLLEAVPYGGDSRLAVPVRRDILRAPAACSAEPSERGADHEHGRNGEGDKRAPPRQPP